MHPLEDDARESYQSRIVVIGSCAPPDSSVVRIASSSSSRDDEPYDDVMDVKGTSSSSSTFGTDAAE